jgi:hypothetical protein
MGIEPVIGENASESWLRSGFSPAAKDLGRNSFQKGARFMAASLP